MGHVFCLCRLRGRTQIVMDAVVLTPGGLVPLNGGAFTDCSPVARGKDGICQSGAAAPPHTDRFGSGEAPSDVIYVAAP